MKNNEIKDSILKTLDSNDGKVILITGGWGVGKTYFVTKEILPKLENKYIVISLFGLSSVDELKKLIFSQILNNANLIKRWWNKGKGLFKTVTGFSLFGVGVRFSLSDLNFLESVIDKDTNITFIFDDFERISLKTDIREFIGFFNYLAENKKQKILLICDESKISSDSEYCTFKEKVINKTFVLNPSVDEIEHIIFDGKISQELQDTIKEYIFPIFKAVQSYTELDGALTDKNPINIRTVKKCTDNIKQFWEHSIWQTIKFNPTDKSHGLQTLTVLTMENDKATLHKKDLANYLDRYWSFSDDTPNEEEMRKQKYIARVKNEYGINQIFSYITQYNSLFDFIDNGYFDDSVLKSNYEISALNDMKNKGNNILYRDESYAKEFQYQIRNEYLSQATTYADFNDVVLYFRSADYLLAGVNNDSASPIPLPNDKEIFLEQFKKIIDNMTPRDLIILRHNLDNDNERLFGTERYKSLDFIRNDMDTILEKSLIEAYKCEIDTIIKKSRRKLLSLC